MREFRDPAIEALAFWLMILAFAAGLAPALHAVLLSVARVSVHVAVFLCVARAVPVLLDARRLL